ncbi:MAG: FtsQ-type POTRA domain-containing protein [Bifidobacterium aquikefiri]|uniref:Cell division protein FtsQ n=1 Tax=Bifidobacterium aquikefiri TaxID=1653207 RepID=A0A261G774_9BIFI|nr:FtsQ-type POTRA domain-containing protein [Bifidobacterium aquikefiri]OZG67043.1 cell division protein FtsQ [Bifidobacterium aquikefiri]
MARKTVSSGHTPHRDDKGRSVRSAESGRKPQSAHSGDSPRTARSDMTTSSSDGDFVDARVLDASESVDERVARSLHEQPVEGEDSGPIPGMFTRPKVVDFTARLKERRKAGLYKSLTRISIVVSATALVVLLVWMLFFSSVFRFEISGIKVTGANQWVSSNEISAIAAKQVGKSLLLVSTETVENQVGALPGVTSAKAEKLYPHGIRISVKSEKPAAVLKSSNNTLTAVDSEARILNTVTAATVTGIPEIQVSTLKGGLANDAVKQALKILASLPESMRQSITKVTANTQDSITTEISSGKYTIVWGDASQLELKKAVVDKIINDPSKIGSKHDVDVSAPLRPIIQ